MFEKKSFSVGALHGCTCRSLVYSHHPHRICWQKKTALDVGAQDTPAVSSVPWSRIDKNKESIVFSHTDFKMLNPKICLEDIWRWMPYSMSPSLPVMQMGSVWRRFPQLHILWSFFLLLKHQRWTLWEGLCKQQVKPIAQEGVGVVSKTGLFSLESLLIMTASQTNKIRSRRQLLSCFSISLWKGLECVGGALRLEGTCNLKHSDTTYIFIRAARFWMDLSNMSCSQAIFIIL